MTLSIELPYLSGSLALVVFRLVLVLPKDLDGGETLHLVLASQGFVIVRVDSSNLVNDVLTPWQLAGIIEPHLHHTLQSLGSFCVLRGEPLAMTTPGCVELHDPEGVALDHLQRKR